MAHIPKGPSTREILGNPRFPLKGSLKGDIDIAINIDVDIDIDLDARGTWQVGFVMGLVGHVLGACRGYDTNWTYYVN